MKLGRSTLGIVALVGLTGCGASLTPVAAPRRLPPVHLTSAVLHGSGEAPKVGKSQRTDASGLDDEEGKRELSSHGGLDRKHGGFSGYK
jgi:hypothetical protein